MLYQDSLNYKITNAMERIESIYHETDGKCYLSFSGGKDSMAVLAIIKMCEDIYTIPINSIPAVFADTGLELDTIVAFVKWVSEHYYRNVAIIHPTTSFPSILDKYGKPMKSKLKSEFLHRWYDRQDLTAFEYLIGNKNFHNVRLANKDVHLLHDEFDIRASEKCCHYLKKRPFEQYGKANGFKGYLLGTRSAEGGARELNAMIREKNGGLLCTSYKKGMIVKMPIVDWTNEEVDQFIKDYHIPLSKAYTEQGYTRTGCYLCPFSLRLQENLRKLYLYEPNKYKASLFWLKDVYIAQGVELPFDEQYEDERKNKWIYDYGRMRYEMLLKYRPKIAYKYSVLQNTLF